MLCHINKIKIENPSIRVLDFYVFTQLIMGSVSETSILYNTCIPFYSIEYKRMYLVVKRYTCLQLLKL